MSEHVLTGEDRGYAIVAAEDLAMDGVTYVALIVDGEVKLSAVGSMISLHAPTTPVRLEIGDTIWLEGIPARVDWVQRQGAGRGDFVIGAVSA